MPKPRSDKEALSGQPHRGPKYCHRHCSHAQIQAAATAAATARLSIYISRMWLPHASWGQSAMSSLQSNLLVLPQGGALCKGVLQH